jgi:hypothetical protein
MAGLAPAIIVSGGAAVTARAGAGLAKFALST